MHRRRKLLSSLLLAFALAFGPSACTPGIGDECETNFECDTQDGAVCDVSVPGGYCTVNDCVPNGCPDSSVCVEFNEIDSYCMSVCLVDDDCRPEHVCREVGTYGQEGYGYCYVAPEG